MDELRCKYCRDFLTEEFLKKRMYLTPLINDVKEGQGVCIHHLSAIKDGESYACTKGQRKKEDKE
ncbi:MAG: hypothetical protein WCX97_03630 [Candidatus Magasanikbacteria bacterium]